MAKYTILLWLLLAFSTNAQQNIEEELLIFVQPNQQSAFTANNLNVLQSTLKEQNIAVKLLDVTQLGAPSEVGFTPFLVYRNHLGRKVYKGRYTTHQRLSNFIRTVRHLPEASINYTEKEVFVKAYPRAALLLKPKITAPTGNTNNLEQKKALEQALKGLEKGFKEWAYNQEFAVADGDELFYMNFYPYISEDGKIYVSSELYSHYDCHTPIYQQYDEPAEGKSIADAFAQAGKQMLAEVERQLQESEAGDALHFLSKKIKTTPWEKLPLSTLNAPESSNQAINMDLKLPTTWIFEGPTAPKAPVLTFSFPAPLRHYGGEVKKITGQMTLPQASQLQGMQGTFIVDVNSLQMGQKDLDGYVKGSLLMVSDHPKATLTFKRIVGDDLQLQLGRLTTAQIEAELTLLGKSSTIIATTQLEPILNPEGELRLQVNTQFTAYDLTGNYNIHGPDGPAEANNQLLFQANFWARPVE